MGGNILDNIISYISPMAGAKRAAWRYYGEDIERIRRYDAGSHDRLNTNWMPINESGQQTDTMQRDIIRARARDLERNSDLANSVVGAFKRNVVGKGYTLRCMVEDKEIEKQIEKLWGKWCKAKNCDVTGTQSFNQILRMMVQRKKFDGGILIKKCYTEGGIVPFQLQLLEVDEIYREAVSNSGNRIVDGIEINKYNKPVGFWIKQYALDGFSLDNPAYVPAEDMIFYFSKKRASQIREMSDLTQTMTRVRDANEFMTAVSVKERIAACLAVFIKKVKGMESTVGGGRLDENKKRESYKGKRLAPGMITELNTGDEVDVVNPAGQATDAAGFIKLMQRMVGAGQGLSYEATSRDMSQTNYSSARQGAIEDELTYAEDMELLMDIMSDIYETFVVSAVLAGKIVIKDFWNNKEKYLEHEWVAVPKKWIDPLKEASANKTALQTGQKTFQQIAAENGRDWREQIDEMLEALEYARKNGTEIGGIIYGQKKEELNAD